MHRSWCTSEIYCWSLRYWFWLPVPARDLAGAVAVLAGPDKKKKRRYERRSQAAKQPVFHVFGKWKIVILHDGYLEKGQKPHINTIHHKAVALLSTAGLSCWMPTASLQDQPGKMHPGAGAKCHPIMPGKRPIIGPPTLARESRMSPWAHVQL